MIQQSIQQQLDFQYLTLLKLLESVSITHLSFVPETKKWSVLQEFAHLASYHLIFISRIEQILLGTTDIEKYNPDLDPVFIEWQKLSKEQLITNLIEARVDLKSVIDKLSLEDLSINTNHPLYGVQTLEQWLYFFIYHEGHHVFSMQRKCTQLAFKGCF